MDMEKNNVVTSLLTHAEQMKYDRLKEKALKELEIRTIKNEIREIQKKGSWAERTGQILASSTSKLMMSYIFLLCTIITIYAMIVMYLKEDLSALPVLITAIVGETISYAIYSVKAYKGKKSEVDAALEREKFEWEKDPNRVENNSCATDGFVPCEDSPFDEEESDVVLEQEEINEMSNEEDDDTQPMVRENF